MSDTQNQHWFLQPNSSSSFRNSSMAYDSNSATTTQITNPNPQKPIKRRSRSSKRTPTTHLNANAAEFRALVQQFTGYNPSKTAATSCLIGYRKGPVTLNFQLGSVSFQNSNESWSDYDEIQLRKQQDVVDNRLSCDGLSEDLNIQTRSGEVELDEFGSLMMGHGVDLMDDFDLDFEALKPVSDQSFDMGCSWNVQNQFPYLYQTN